MTPVIYRFVDINDRYLYINAYKIDYIRSQEDKRGKYYVVHHNGVQSMVSKLPTELEESQKSGVGVQSEFDVSTLGNPTGAEWPS